MSVKTYVYPHPINAFVIGRLGISVEEFCELHGYKQGTVSSWVTRNRSIKAIPCDFLYSLSLAASLPMDYVYKELLQLEEQFLLSIDPKREKKYVD